MIVLELFTNAWSKLEIKTFSKEVRVFSFHFILVRTVSVMVAKADLNLESAIGPMDSKAFSQWFLARLRVLSSPSELRTASKAAWTSPGFENLLAIMSSSSGNWAQANKTGAVARPSSRSAAAGFPSCSELKKKQFGFYLFQSTIAVAQNCQFSDVSAPLKSIN